MDKKMIANFVKVLLFFLMMIFGFFFVYCAAWHLVGLPMTVWMVWICLALAGLSEFGYCVWIMECGQEDE